MPPCVQRVGPEGVAKSPKSKRAGVASKEDITAIVSTVKGIGKSISDKFKKTTYSDDGFTMAKNEKRTINFKREKSFKVGEGTKTCGDFTASVDINGFY